MSSRFRFSFWIVFIVLLSPFSVVAIVQHIGDTCVDFSALDIAIRDGLITKKMALATLQQKLPQLKQYYYAHNAPQKALGSWKFPLSGYDVKAIGGKNGSGYVASGYNYFDGNRHGGHPAHDIFIADKNQDGIDDNSRQRVNVVSVSCGIVIATEHNWKESSDSRGGNYIWVYDPESDCLVYYAHNSNVLVKPCDILQPGMVIAQVGRTGLNALKKRSPTHLHFMVLQLDKSGYPKPMDSYKLLTAAKRQ